MENDSEKDYDEILEEARKEYILPFREFLLKCEPMLTIFGIFNALTLFSATIKPYFISLLLGACFLILSCLVLLEIIKFTRLSKNDSWSYLIFELGLVFSEFLFIYYFFLSFYPLSVLTPYIILFFVYFYILLNLSSFFITKNLAIKLKSNKKKRRIFVQIHGSIIFLLTLLITFLTAKYTFKMTDNYLKSMSEKSKFLPDTLKKK